MPATDWIPEAEYQHMINVLTEISYERKRQYAKWGPTPQLHPAQFLSILTEEVGEVAKEINDHHFLCLHPDQQANLRNELVQIAAVAVKFIEYIDQQKRWFDAAHGKHLNPISQ